MAWEEQTIGACRLIRGDCREVLPTLGPVDAVVTDPPYGVELTTKTNDHRHSRFYDAGRSMRASIVYDDSPEVVRSLIQEVMPVLLAQSQRCAIYCGYRLLYDYPRPTSMGVVYCASGPGRDPWGFGCFNPILYYGKCPYLAAGRGGRPNSFADIQPNPDKIDHPCPKPLKWMLWLVRRASLKGETILDPFMGSGTTGVACVQLGRSFIGIEVEPRYFDLACKRIEDATRQGDLFAPAPRKPQQLALA